MPGDAPMDPEFVRLVEIVEYDAVRMTSPHWEDRDDPKTGIPALYAWHRAEVERAEAAAVADAEYRVARLTEALNKATREPMGDRDDACSL